jgi:hypothetical protein
VRRNSDRHSNGFRGLLSIFMQISKYLLKLKKIVSFFTNAGTYVAGHFGYMPYCCEVVLCFVLYALPDLWLCICRFFFVQVNEIKIIYYGQYLMAEDG